MKYFIYYFPKPIIDFIKFLCINIRNFTKVMENILCEYYKDDLFFYTVNIIKKNLNSGRATQINTVLCVHSNFHYFNYA